MREAPWRLAAQTNVRGRSSPHRRHGSAWRCQPQSTPQRSGQSAWARAFPRTARRLSWRRRRRTPRWARGANARARAAALRGVTVLAARTGLSLRVWRQCVWPQGAPTIPTTAHVVISGLFCTGPTAFAHAEGVGWAPGRGAAGKSAALAAVEGAPICRRRATPKGAVWALPTSARLMEPHPPGDCGEFAFWMGAHTIIILYLIPH